jgi:hypothetical protein
MELNFQILVLIAAIVILIMSLIIIGYMMNRNQRSQPWPPVVGKCPDFWNIDDSGKMCNPPESGINAGKTGTTLDLSVHTNKCALYSWATNNNVSWDGITLDGGEKPPGC